MLQNEGVHIVDRVLPEDAVDMPITRYDLSTIEVTAIGLAQKLVRLGSTLRQVAHVLLPRNETDRDSQPFGMRQVRVFAVKIGQMARPYHHGQVLKRLDIANPE